MSKTIRDLMKTNPISLDSKSPVLEAAKKMRDAHIGNVLVTEDGKLHGIVTDRDLVVRCLATGGDPSKVSLGELCTGELVTLTPDDAPDAAVQVMREKAVRRVPVVEANRAIGILSIGDLAITQDRKSALADISAAPPNH